MVISTTFWQFLMVNNLTRGQIFRHSSYLLRNQFPLHSIILYEYS